MIGKQESARKTIGFATVDRGAGSGRQAALTPAACRSGTTISQEEGDYAREIR
jgi:hypothetical protein